MAETLNQFGVPEHHVRAFTTNVMMDVQRQGGLFRDRVTTASYTGEGVQAVNYIGQARFNRREHRWDDTKLTELAHTQRWVYPFDNDFATMVDRVDKLRMIYDPTSPYVEAVRIGYNVLEDETIINQFFAVAFTGKLGATQEPFDTTNNVIAHGGTGLTIAKLRAARKKLKQFRIELTNMRSNKGRGEVPYIGVTAQAMDNLLSDTSVTSADFNTVKALVDGEVNTFMGFEFVHCEDLPLDPADVTTTFHPVWVRSGMHLGDWQNLMLQITPRPDKNNLPQIHGCCTLGTTRLHTKKVLQLQTKNNV